MKCENLDVWNRISSNIAEGMEKESNKDKVRFLNIAEGSIAELITQIYIGIKIGYIKKEVGLSWKNELNEIIKMLKGFKKIFIKG